MKGWLLETKNWVKAFFGQMPQHFKWNVNVQHLENCLLTKISRYRQDWEYAELFLLVKDKNLFNKMGILVMTISSIWCWDCKSGDLRNVA